MTESLFGIGYYAAREMGMSKEEILKLIGTDEEVDDVDREIVEAYEIFTSTTIAQNKQKRSKRELISNCVTSLKKDLEDCDHILDLIFKEIQKRKLENLSIVELFNLGTKITEIKDKKMDTLLKYKNLLLEA